MFYQAGAIRVVALDSLTAIFHRASGQTHIVTEPIPEILAVLGDGKTDLSTLIRRLGLNDNAATLTLLNERLDELVAVGVVERT